MKWNSKINLVVSGSSLVCAIISLFMWQPTWFTIHTVFFGLNFYQGWKDTKDITLKKEGKHNE